MARNVKIRYDKGLKKYHIEYHKITDQDNYRYNIFKRINDKHDLTVMIETHLGSINKPEPVNYARTIEGVFAKHGLRYQVRPIEIQGGKLIFGFLSGGKKTETHYAITFIIPKSALTKALFLDFLCEFDIQIGYKSLMDDNTFFDDMLKGYIDNVFDENYFGDSFYDSRIFNKFLATEDITADQ